MSTDCVRGMEICVRGLETQWQDIQLQIVKRQTEAREKGLANKCLHVLQHLGTNGRYVYSNPGSPRRLVITEERFYVDRDGGILKVTEIVQTSWLRQSSRVVFSVWIGDISDESVKVYIPGNWKSTLGSLCEVAEERRLFKLITEAKAKFEFN